MPPLDSTGYLSPTSYGEKDILFHRPTTTEQEQANTSQSVRARRAVDEDGEVLLRAADQIEKNGWFRHGPKWHREGSDPACLLVAVCQAANESGADANSALKRAGFADPSDDAPAWNDDPSRTKAEVIARLRSAAEQRA